MAKIDKQKLLRLLQGQPGWVESAFLSERLGVSMRTIRSYVSVINEEAGTALIQSSYRGYRFDPHSAEQHAPRAHGLAETPDERVHYIIRRLISSKDSLDFFALTGELYVSDATLERDLSKVRRMLEPYGLRVTREREQLLITGLELQKRKFINDLVAKENRGILPVAQAGLVAGQDTYSALNAYVPGLLEKHEIYADDYGLSNIIHHLMITIERIANGQSIAEQVPLERMENRKEFEVALAVKRFVGEHYHVLLSDEELYYIALTISSNSNLLKYKLINPGNIHQYIEEKYILLAKMAIQRLEETFYLNQFHDHFLVKFTIHLHNLMQRAKIGAHIKNPLVAKIKATYPLIYDMAVFVINEIRKIEDIPVSDDEIAFIAFHIGAYLEERKIARGRVNALFVYADYHNMHQPALTKIQQEFEREMHVTSAVSLKDFCAPPAGCHVILLAADAVLTVDIPVVRVNIFPTAQDFTHIRRRIEEVRRHRQVELIRLNIRRFAVPRLFKRNYYAADEFEMIRRLAGECVRLGCCPVGFVREVLDREETSSTSFPNSVAVPHSMQHNAKRSFLSVVINDEPMTWGKNKVQIIVLIGLCKDDLTAFQEIFDDLIAVLSEPFYTKKLAECKNYEMFLETLTASILEQKSGAL